MNMSALCLSETGTGKDSNLLMECPRELLSVSRWVSKILQSHLPVKPGSTSELSFLITVRNVAAGATIDVARRVGHVLKSEKVAATVRGGGSGGGGEEVGESGSASGGGGLSSDGGTARRKGSWNDMPKFLVAGAVSTMISRTCIAPLERIKLECMVQGSKRSWLKIVQCIWDSEGLSGFWKGNGLNLLRMVPSKSINFIAYDMYVGWLLRLEGKNRITNHDSVIGGAISGLLSTVLCIPLDTVRTRLAAPGGEALGGVAGCLCSMVQNEGFYSLYKGLNAALISMGPSSAVFYLVYDILKNSHLSKMKKDTSGERSDQLGPVRTLLYSAIAGAVSETVTYPLEVIRRQQQLQQSSNLRLSSAFIDLVKREGVESLFVGLVPSTLQVLPAAALSYFCYEMMKTILKI
ncbi:putative mitochondrial adenine nucleotide transporter BTL3 [Curcuma longa]|uniref:putative mitochondrial adenine nucleotide transporter BTL3 n=1 Tax=Curcuma longa TaxID=136217 RepID=UPI003D9E328A